MPSLPELQACFAAALADARHAGALVQRQRCRLGAAEEMPFACPEHCLFFEPRPITDAGWHRIDNPDR